MAGRGPLSPSGAGAYVDGGCQSETGRTKCRRQIGCNGRSGRKSFVKPEASSLRYLSVCSGIEAASVAWSPLGFQPVAFAEVEPFPCAVLKHHYPTVPNWG